MYLVEQEIRDYQDLCEKEMRIFGTVTYETFEEYVIDQIRSGVYSECTFFPNEEEILRIYNEHEIKNMKDMGYIEKKLVEKYQRLLKRERK